VLGSVLAVGMFGCLAYFLFCVRHTTASAFMAIGNTDKPGAPLSTGMPVAKIHPDGRSSIVKGILIGSMGGPSLSAASSPSIRSERAQLNEQRQSLMGEMKGF
jgi:hypothetical protein